MNKRCHISLEIGELLSIHALKKRRMLLVLYESTVSIGSLIWTKGGLSLHLYVCISCEGATQPSSSNLFQREFPKLGVDGEGQSTEESAKGKDSEEREPAGSSSSNVPPRFTGLCLVLFDFYV